MRATAETVAVSESATATDTAALEAQIEGQKQVLTCCSASLMTLWPNGMGGSLPATGAAIGIATAGNPVRRWWWPRRSA